MKKIFLDTETTGLAPGQIAQLSLIIEEDNKELIAKNYFFDIDYITQGAEEACGRGLDFYHEASKGLRFKDYKDEIHELLSDGTLIAHNLKFDENFISTEFWRENIVFKPTDRFDTMSYFVNILKIPGRYGKYKNPKLEELVDCFKIDKERVMKYCEMLFKTDEKQSFHDARYDTTSMFVAFQVYKESLYNQNNWAQQFCLGR
jgi:DNA polymerase III alpha subunit (gram-positive type)